VTNNSYIQELGQEIEKQFPSFHLGYRDKVVNHNQHAEFLCSNIPRICTQNSVMLLHLQPGFKPPDIISSAQFIQQYWHVEENS